MGFDSHLHVANALISVYCKCANLEDALYIFVNIGGKDVVSWNSIIAGYARHGLAVQGIGLFERMKNQGVKPDAITFLGVPSSCWHAGFVERRKKEQAVAGTRVRCATHVQLANLYATVRFWDQAARVRKLMKGRRLETNPGRSWIEIKNEVHRFRARDWSNTRASEILNVLDRLDDRAKCLLCTKVNALFVGAARTMKCERCCFHGKRRELIALDVHGVGTKLLSFMAC
ncbi:hypothetical protein POTOM_026104 [Populus tomentosa]|uniref:Pentatricopeptide repeat-containing protein n=1 Tax=Populus tomentosa TaxID=118781 RepID=A0A8X8CXY7_POPTO|nr:hypothetical protein POTOM_026104 [Populus tomentosa]